MAAVLCNADWLRVSSTLGCFISATCFRTRTLRLLAFSLEKFARQRLSWVSSPPKRVIPQAPRRFSTTSRHQKAKQSSRKPASIRIADRYCFSCGLIFWHEGLAFRQRDVENDSERFPPIPHLH